MKWDQTILNYLGVHLPKLIALVGTLNYDLLLSQIKTDIQRWNCNPFVSLIQRIETAKMNTL